MPDQRTGIDRLALGLGFFSIGLGLAQLFAPRKVSRAAGMPKNDTLMRTCGLREVTSGIGILSQRKTAGWMWLRVAGDAMDLALLGSAMSARKAKRSRVIAATATVAGVAALDMFCGRRLSARNDKGTRSYSVTKSIIIDRSPEELYSFWRQFDRLPSFMNHLESVEQVGHNVWHWVAKGPAGRTVEWNAEITEEIPNEMIAWRSLNGSEVDNSGSITFERASGRRGTLVRVELEYSPPAGAIGATVAKLWGEDPEKQIAIDLRRFKQLMETGEIARTEGQPAGPASRISRKYDQFVRS